MFMPLAMEAIVAFFLEATLIGLWIFGWDRLPSRRPPLPTTSALAPFRSALFLQVFPFEQLAVLQ
jgi:cytochrome bd-type quinol oxidase subunit 1